MFKKVIITFIQHIVLIAKGLIIKFSEKTHKSFFYIFTNYSPCTVERCCYCSDNLQHSGQIPWKSETSESRPSFIAFFISGKSQKSQDAKSGEWSGWFKFAICFLAKRKEVMVSTSWRIQLFNQSLLFMNRIVSTSKYQQWVIVYCCLIN